MDTSRKIAIVVGVFYLLANIAGPIGYGLELPILDAPDYLTEVAANETAWAVGALLELVMAVAVVGIAITIYPVLRRHNESAAIGYIAARIAEGMIFVIGVISLLGLLTVSQQYVEAGTPDAPYFFTLGELLLAARDWGGHVVLDVAVFPLGALILYLSMYRSRLIPRWLSGLGLIGAALYWIASLLVMFALIVPLSTIHIALQAPLGVQEILFALWLIFKGFDSKAIAREVARREPVTA